LRTNLCNCQLNRFINVFCCAWYLHRRFLRFVNARVCACRYVLTVACAWSALLTRVLACAEWSQEAVVERKRDSVAGSSHLLWTWNGNATPLWLGESDWYARLHRFLQRWLQPQYINIYYVSKIYARIYAQIDINVFERVKRIITFSPRACNAILLWDEPSQFDITTK
jgi:hypothetical protein